MSERKISEKSLENLRKSNQESNLLTREAIETALLQLLEKKELAKISISELVKRAGVSRAAFYRNYDSKEEILQLDEARTMTIRGVSKIIQVPLMITFFNQLQTVRVSVACATDEFKDADYKKFNMSLELFICSLILFLFFYKV